MAGARCVPDAARRMVPAGEQVAVLRTGTVSTAPLPFGIRPFVEAIVGETAAPEVFLDVSFGNVPGQYGHASACQVVHLLAVLQDAAVKFLNIYCLLNK